MGEHLKQSLRKIKEVCSEYFHQYETNLEEVKIRAHVLENKYSEWSKLLIEPHSLSEARLFALETRIHEEEEMRIKEYDFLRDTIKKLLYSLE
jgi:predicted Ser/Thr protein kinase